MKSCLCRIVATLPLAGLAWMVLPVAAATRAPDPDPSSQMHSNAEALHVLNRMGYGPTPGEVQAVAREGVDVWINQQLDPQAIPDPAVDAALAHLGTLNLPCTRIVEAFREEAQIRRERNHQAGLAGKGVRKAGPRPLDPPEALVADAFAQLQDAKLIRAVLSNRQLNEVLVDFWFNHFNIDARKDLDRATIESYERDTIRPHIWGSFRDLLGATAHSPAMLVYLDNWKSSRVFPLRRGRRVVQRGINENYGRELMELHTVGVDAGYTQADVISVARCFTGWTIDPRDGEFRYNARWHDEGDKVVMGVRIPAYGGIDDGERVLDLLASSPATAHHLALELCERFIADHPPQSAVDRVASVFLSTHGDLPSVYRCLFTSPEFLDLKYAGAKSKSPFEFVASALRATGAALVPVIPDPTPQGPEQRPGFAMRQTAFSMLFQMGQQPYTWEPPTGFSENSSRWITSGALVQRFNLSLAYAAGRFRDARPNYAELLRAARRSSTDSVIAALDASMLGGTLSPATRTVLERQTVRPAHSRQPVPALPRILALILGSPDFQRR